MRQEIVSKLGLERHLHLSLSMQRSLHALQLPVIELAQWIREQIEETHCLEYEEEPELPLETLLSTCSKKYTFETSYKPSLFEHLMQQASYTFSSKEELAIAENLIGNLDERGFFAAFSTLSLREQAILEKIQAFDPPGIGACNLRHCLLLQLALKERKKSLAYTIVEKHFEDLLHNRLPLLQKKCACSAEALHLAIFHELALLDLNPASRFEEHIIQPIVPDIIVSYEKEAWKIDINEKPLPSFKLSSSAHKQSIAIAKNLLLALKKRHTTLSNITAYLVAKQSSFLKGESKALSPMNLKEIAAQFGLHTSTIARAIAHKYLFSPVGLFPLHSFFTQGLRSDASLSGDTLKQELLRLINEENKNDPLSDKQLVEKLRLLGISCARRTIAKYRHQLQISEAAMRRRWH